MNKQTNKEQVKKFLDENLDWRFFNMIQDKMILMEDNGYVCFLMVCVNNRNRNTSNLELKYGMNVLMKYSNYRSNFRPQTEYYESNSSVTALEILSSKNGFYYYISVKHDRGDDVDFDEPINKLSMDFANGLIKTGKAVVVCNDTDDEGVYIQKV